MTYIPKHPEEFSSSYTRILFSLSIPFVKEKRILASGIEKERSAQRIASSFRGFMRAARASPMGSKYHTFASRIAFATEVRFYPKATEECQHAGWCVSVNFEVRKAWQVHTITSLSELSEISCYLENPLV